MPGTETISSTWYIPIHGNLMVIPTENITWDGNAYRFDMQLRHRSDARRCRR